jgi:hypothetical protein
LTKLFLSILFFLFSFQENEFKFLPVKTIDVKANFITTDNLGNLYVIRNDVLEKYDGKGNFLKTYSNKQLGKIEQADVSNAMKIAIFYKDFRQVTFLDNQLSPVAENIRLDNYGLEQATLICLSHSSGIWFYDNVRQSLIRYDNNFQKTNEVNNLSNITGEEISPNFMMEANNYLYLNNPVFGIYVFDVYGTYYKTIPLKNLRSFQIDGDNLIFNEDNSLHTYNMKLLETQIMALPEKEIISARAEKNLLFIQQENSVKIYSVEKK